MNSNLAQDQLKVDQPVINHEEFSHNFESQQEQESENYLQRNEMKNE